MVLFWSRSFEHQIQMSSTGMKICLYYYNTDAPSCSDSRSRDFSGRFMLSNLSHNNAPQASAELLSDIWFEPGGLEWL